MTQLSVFGPPTFGVHGFPLMVGHESLCIRTATGSSISPVCICPPQKAGQTRRRSGQRGSSRDGSPGLRHIAPGRLRNVGRISISAGQALMQRARTVFAGFRRASLSRSESELLQSTAGSHHRPSHVPGQRAVDPPFTRYGSRSSSPRLLR